MTRVFILETDRSATGLEAIEASEPRLSPDQVRRGAAIKDETRRRNWRGSHIALRLVLERTAGAGLGGVPFTISDSGRPSLPPPAPDFSLSHTTGLAAIAVDFDGPVGIDVEATREVTLSPRRQQQIMAAATALTGDVPRDLLVAWTRLEALGKARGKGVGAILDQIRGAEDLSPDRLADVMRASATGLRFEGLILPDGYVGTLAFPMTSPGLHIATVPETLDDLRAFAKRRDEVDLPGSTGQKGAVRSVAQPG